jgi:hypothetical protein
MLMSFMTYSLGRRGIISLCNNESLPYTEAVNLGEYFDCLAPNSWDSVLGRKLVGTAKARKVVDCEIIPVDMPFEYMGKPLMLDDITVPFPNYYENSTLLKLYPGLTLNLPLQRQLFSTSEVNVFTLGTTQSYERPIKLIRELQSEFALRAELARKAFPYLSWVLPFLKKYVIVECTYYDKPASRDIEPVVLPRRFFGLLPPKASDVVAVHNANAGLIKPLKVLINLKKVNYDTWYFRRKFYKQCKDCNLKCSDCPPYIEYLNKKAS